MTVLFLSTRGPLMTVGNCDGADASVPLIAGSLEEALAGIEAWYASHGDPVGRVDVVDFAGSSKLLLVRAAADGDDDEPLVLLFKPGVEVPSVALESERSLL
jgi:hypothetical protein